MRSTKACVCPVDAENPAQYNSSQVHSGARLEDLYLMLNAANLLTTLRIVLTLPFLLAVDSGNYAVALGLFFVASVTDFADGYVARKFGQQTQLGRLLDPLADKVLIACSYIAMALPHKGLPSVPIWLAAGVVARDVLILSGSLLIYLAIRFKDFKPSWISKVNTFIELGLIVYFLSINAAESLSFLRPLEPLCYGIVMAGVIASGVDYGIRGVLILRAHRRDADDVALLEEDKIPPLTHSSERR